MIVLNKCRSHHVDSMFPLDLVTVVEQKGLITSQLILDWLNWDFVDRVTHLESITRLDKFFGNCEDILRE